MFIELELVSSQHRNIINAVQGEEVQVLIAKSGCGGQLFAPTESKVEGEHLCAAAHGTSTYPAAEGQAQCGGLRPQPQIPGEEWEGLGTPVGRLAEAGTLGTSNNP